MNRLKKLMNVKAFSKERLASALGIEEAVIDDWQNGACEIDEENLEVLCRFFGVHKEYLSGLPYKLTIPVYQWETDLQEDHSKAEDELREFIECTYGKPVFYIEKRDSPNKSKLHNTIIVCREGNSEIFQLTEQQMDFLEKFLDSHERQNQD